MLEGIAFVLLIVLACSPMLAWLTCPFIAGRVRVGVAILACVLLLLLPAAGFINQAPTFTESRIVDECLAPYVEIDLPDNSKGSGVVVDLHGTIHILTAAHVVMDRDDRPHRAVVIRKGTAARFTEWKAHPVKVWRREQGELALLAVDDPTGLVPVRFTGAEILQPGESCLYIGTPCGFHGSLERTCINRVGDTQIDRRYLVVNGNAWYGNSGGPIFVQRRGHWVLVGIMSRLVWIGERSPLCANTQEAIAAILAGS